MHQPADLGVEYTKQRDVDVTACSQLQTFQTKEIEYSSLNSLLPCDAIWWCRSQSTLASVMACCLMAPSHYHQCLFLISEIQWHSPASNFTGSAEDTILYNESENYTFKFTTLSPRGQWVKPPHIIAMSKSKLIFLLDCSKWQNSSHLKLAMEKKDQSIVIMMYLT